MTGIWLLSYIVLWLLVLFALIGLAGAFRQIGILYVAGPSSRPRTKLRQGQKLPEVMLQTVAGQSVRLSEVISKPTPLLVVTPGCGGCAVLLRQIGSGEMGGNAAARIVVVSMANATETEDMLQKARMHGEGVVLIDPDREVRRVWGVMATPTSILVDEQLKVQKQTIGFLDIGMLGGDAVALATNIHEQHGHA